MTGGMIWMSALLVYLGFRAWYDNWRGPLRPDEIDHFLADAAGRFPDSGNDPERLRAFLSADDGREFVMLNLVKAQPGLVADPESGAMVPGISLLRRYAAQFMPVLFARGGHPGMVARKVGGYVDAWNTEPDPDWTLFGVMRYRSRRDMIKLAAHPKFRAGHPAKMLGTAATFSFPAQRQISLYASPRVTMALICALGAALGHLALLLV